MEEITKILSLATESISKDYFNLTIDGGSNIYRERVYCYELYHQMRCLWPENTDYYINGEVDKAAHPLLGQDASSKKPDFLIHKPGYMLGNHLIIEVKSEKGITAKSSSIKKDLQTLSLFV